MTTTTPSNNGRGPPCNARVSCHSVAAEESNLFHIEFPAAEKIDLLYQNYHQSIIFYVFKSLES